MLGYASLRFKVEADPIVEQVEGYCLKASVNAVTLAVALTPKRLQ